MFRWKVKQLGRVQYRTQDNGWCEEYNANQTISHLKNLDQVREQVVDPELAVGGTGRQESGAYT